MGKITRVLTAALAAGLFVLSAPACGDKNLQTIDYPTAGVALKYDLSPGRTFRGRVRRSQTRQIMGSSVTDAIECDVVLRVKGVDPNRGDTLLVAHFEDVSIDSMMPDEMLASALSAVQGLDIRFNVDETGKITNMPKVPSDTPSDVGMMVEMLLDVLEDSFLVVPGKTLAMGEQWVDSDEKGRKGKLGRFSSKEVTTKVEGLFRHKTRSEDVVQLKIDSEKTDIITTKTGSRENTFIGKKKVLFSTSGNYLAELSGEIRKLDPVAGTTFTKVAVEWKPVGVTQEPTPEANEATGSQAISDPCNPDYVGTEECTEGGSQTISDPCNPDYVGTEECKADGTAPADAAAEGEAAKPEGDPKAAAEGDAKPDAKPAEKKPEAAKL